MMEVIACIGAVLIITRSSIVEPLKDRLSSKVVKFLDCPMCVGFWVGIVDGLVSGSPLLICIRLGFAISAMSFFFVIMSDLISAKLEE